MENLKSILFLSIILVILILGGYWAVSSIEAGNVFIERQKQEELAQKNKELEIELQKIKEEFQTTEQQTPIEEIVASPVVNNTPKDITPSKYQSLINDLQKLVNDGVQMKEKSQGTRVGTVQTFLNIYNNTSKKIDNDYGASTKTDIIKFQKNEGLTADGEAGPSTFRKMIDWLKKQ
jgi:peptidoglycan hydrolase-like protein with peptidoglycan-binding domain